MTVPTVCHALAHIGRFIMQKKTNQNNKFDWFSYSTNIFSINTCRTTLDVYGCKNA